MAGLSTASQCCFSFNLIQLKFSPKYHRIAALNNMAGADGKLYIVWVGCIIKELNHCTLAWKLPTIRSCLAEPAETKSVSYNFPSDRIHPASKQKYDWVLVKSPVIAGHLISESFKIVGLISENFLTTLVAQYFTPISKWVSRSVVVSN